MNIDVWFSKKIHFVGEHGEIDVEIYDYPTIAENGAVDKDRLLLKETRTVANLKQAVRVAMPFTAPKAVLVEWEQMVAVVELQNKILKNFTEQFYTVYVRDYGKEKLEVCEPKDRNATIVMPPRINAKIVKSRNDTGEIEDANGEGRDYAGAEAPAPVEKKSKAVVKSVKKGK